MWQKFLCCSFLCKHFSDLGLHNCITLNDISLPQLPLYQLPHGYAEQKMMGYANGVPNILGKSSEMESGELNNIIHVYIVHTVMFFFFFLIPAIFLGGSCTAFQQVIGLDSQIANAHFLPKTCYFFIMSGQKRPISQNEGDRAIQVYVVNIMHRCQCGQLSTHYFVCLT